MPGIPFHFQVLERTIAALEAAGDPRAKPMREHPAWARLGALGPDLLRYAFIEDRDLLKKVEEILAGTATVDTLPTVEQLELHRKLLMIGYRSLFGKFRDMWPVLDQIHGFLDEMDAIVAAQDADALQAQKQAAEDLKSTLAPLTGASDGGAAIYEAFKQIITLYRPNIQAEAGSASALQTQPLTWRHGEHLRWRGSGALVRAMFKISQGEADPTRRAQLLAFTYGWMSHVATSVTGEPFITNIVGGPYRTHWWRHRMVSHYVDAWTHGRYQTPGAQMSGDEPTPPYAQWADLCRAHLEEAIAVEGAVDGLRAIDAVVDGQAPGGVLPDHLATMLAEAVKQSATGVQPLPLGGFDPKAWNNAFVGAISVLYFMTGGRRPMCSKPLDPPPAGCETPPSWVTSGGTPPSADPDQFVDDSKTATKIVLAILAVLLFLGGLIGAGIAALIAAIEMDPVEWGKLRCHLYWVRYFLFQTEKAIRDLLLWATMIYPQPEDLGAPTPEGPTAPATDTRGFELCKTQVREGFPRQMDGTASYPPDVGFVEYPASPVEGPQTATFPHGGRYPDFAIEDPGWVPTNGDMTKAVPSDFPARTVGGKPAWYGNCVLNAVAVIGSDGKTLVDFNLDADRGYGWMAWRHLAGTFPSAPPINALAV